MRGDAHTRLKAGNPKQLAGTTSLRCTPFSPRCEAHMLHHGSLPISQQATSARAAQHDRLDSRAALFMPFVEGTPPTPPTPTCAEWTSFLSLINTPNCASAPPQNNTAVAYYVYAHCGSDDPTCNTNTVLDMQHHFRHQEDPESITQTVTRSLTGHEKPRKVNHSPPSTSPT